MSCRGSPTALSSRLLQQGWTEVTSFPVLGAVAMNNGAPWDDLSDCERRLWQKLFGCIGRREARGIRWQSRIRALDRVIRPVLSFRAPGWALGSNVRAAVDRLQRRMSSYCVWTARREGECDADFWRRKAQIVAPLLRGKWSHHAAERVHSRAQHLYRDHVPGHAGALVRMRSAQWLQRRRAGTSKLGLRAGGGMPPLRWEEGAQQAAALLGKEAVVF